MIFPLYPFSCILLGMSIFILLRNKTTQIYSNIFLGWMIGSSISGFLLFFVTFFFKFSSSLVHFVTILQFLVSFILFYFIHRLNFRIFIYFDGPSIFYISLIITLATSYYISLKTYSNFPQIFPTHELTSIQTDKIIVNSIMHGSNTNRPFSFFLTNPLHEGMPLKSLPHIYYFAAANSISFQSFESSQIFISILNTLSTVGALNCLSYRFTSNQLLFYLSFFFNGSFSFFRFLFQSDPQLDFIHEIGRAYPTPFYLAFDYLLKNLITSFSLPLSIFSFAFLQFHPDRDKMRHISFLLSFFIPSFPVSICFVFLGTCFPEHFPQSVLHQAFQFLKFFYVKLNFYPFTKEYRFQGIFFAPIVVWIDFLGPLFPYLVFIFIFLHSRRLSFLSFISFSCSIFWTLFRSGNSTLETSLVILSLAFPCFLLSSISTMNTILKKVKNFQIKGFVSFLMYLPFCLFIIGGVISSWKVSESFVSGLNSYDFEAGEFISENSYLNETILVSPNSVSFVSLLCGRNILISEPRISWINGLDIENEFWDLKKKAANGKIAELMTEKNIRFIVENLQNPFFFSNDEQTLKFKSVFQNEQWVIFILTT